MNLPRGWSLNFVPSFDTLKFMSSTLYRAYGILFWLVMVESRQIPSKSIVQGIFMHCDGMLCYESLLKAFSYAIFETCCCQERYYRWCSTGGWRLHSRSVHHDQKRFKIVTISRFQSVGYIKYVAAEACISNYNEIHNEIAHVDETLDSKER